MVFIILQVVKVSLTRNYDHISKYTDCDIIEQARLGMRLIIYDNSKLKSLIYDYDFITPFKAVDSIFLKILIMNFYIILGILYNDLESAYSAKTYKLQQRKRYYFKKKYL